MCDIFERGRDVTPPLLDTTERPTSGAILRPRLLLLAGGIDFQRSEARMASLDTLVDQVQPRKFVCYLGGW